MHRGHAVVFISINLVERRLGENLYALTLGALHMMDALYIPDRADRAASYYFTTRSATVPRAGTAALWNGDRAIACAFTTQRSVCRYNSMAPYHGIGLLVPAVIAVRVAGRRLPTPPLLAVIRLEVVIGDRPVATAP